MQGTDLIWWELLTGMIPLLRWLFQEWNQHNCESYYYALHHKKYTHDSNIVVFCRQILWLAQHQWSNPEKFRKDHMNPCGTNKLTKWNKEQLISVHMHTGVLCFLNFLLYYEFLMLFSICTLICCAFLTSLLYYEFLILFSICTLICCAFLTFLLYYEFLMLFSICTLICCAFLTFLLYHEFLMLFSICTLICCAFLTFLLYYEFLMLFSICTLVCCASFFIFVILRVPGVV